MIIRCDVCGADPDGRWTSPPAMIFRDRYREDGSIRKDDSGQDVFVYACRDHLSESEKKRFRNGRGTGGGELR